MRLDEPECRLEFSMATPLGEVAGNHDGRGLKSGYQRCQGVDLFEINVPSEMQVRQVNESRHPTR